MNGDTSKRKEAHLSKKEYVTTTSAHTEKVRERFLSHLVKYWKLA